MTTASTYHREPSPLPVEPLNESGYESTLAEAQRLLKADPSAPLDAVIHGVRVRLHTNNAHWRKLWSLNWFAPGQWATLTGQSSLQEPRVHLYATVPNTPGVPQASYSRAQDTAFLSGDTPYGPLRALALEAVVRLLAEEEAVHFVPALCLTENQSGTLWLRSPDTDPTTVASALLQREDAQILAWDGVFIRYGLVRMVDGVTLLPTLVIDEKGNPTSGYRLFPWLDEYGYWEPRADARCLTLDGTEEYCFARDLDLGRRPEAFAFPIEQRWYIPTQVVAAQPGLACELWNAELENPPPLSPQLSDRFGAWAREVASTSARPLTEQIGSEAAVEALCRLRATPQARAMISPDRLWPGRAGGHPGRPVQIERARLLGNDGPAPLTAQELSGRLTSENGEAARTLTELLIRATDVGDV